VRRPLRKKTNSADRAVAKKAEAELRDIAKALQAWARKNGVKLHRHVEAQPDVEARIRKCQAIIDTDVGGDPMTCVLIGKQRRNCLYSCFSALGPGVE